MDATEIGSSRESDTGCSTAARKDNKNSKESRGCQSRRDGLESGSMDTNTYLYDAEVIVHWM
jgi:hypothetical protein